jgi:sarcosine oxidase
MKYDVAIIGLGAMGSAAAYALAKRGAKVIAFDRLTPPHHMELWADLEREYGEKLFMQTGGLWVGPEKGELVSGALESVRTHHLAHDLLSAADIMKRFPAYHARNEWVGLLEHRAGMLAPEKCVSAFHAGAKRFGAELHTNTEVNSWSVGPQWVTVVTPNWSCTADRIIVAAGAWLPGLADKMGLKIPLEIERQMSHWFTPSSNDVKFRASNTPVALFEMPGDMFLTMGDEGHGVKCGKHHSGLPTSPADVNREVSDADNAAARAILEEVMPGAGGKLKEARVCLYTNTPDRHFIIDWMEKGRSLLLSPCSGHGFKFASGIGEIAAQLVTDGKTPMDLSLFSLSRFK